MASILYLHYMEVSFNIAWGRLSFISMSSFPWNHQPPVWILILCVGGPLWFWQPALFFNTKGTLVSKWRGYASYMRMFHSLLLNTMAYAIFQSRSLLLFSFKSWTLDNPSEITFMIICESGNHVDSQSFTFLLRWWNNQIILIIAQTIFISQHSDAISRAPSGSG